MASLGGTSSRQSAEQGSQQTSSQFSTQLAQSQQQQAAAASGQATSQTFVDPAQAGFLDFLRTQGQGIAQGQLGPGGVGQFAQQQAQQLGGIGQNLLGVLQGGAQQTGLGGQLAGAVGGVTPGGAPGTQFLQDRISQQNPFLNEQITQLGQDIGQEFRESILPGIRRGANQIGALGGGRQGVAEGIAAEGAQRSFAAQAANLRFSDVGLRQAAAAQLQQASLAGGQLAGAGLGQQLTAAQAGLGSLGGLAGLGLSPFGAAFGPLEQLGALIGGPTVLSQGQSAQQSASQGFGSSLQQALSQSQSQGTSFGQSRGKNVGFDSSFGTLFTG